MPGVLQALDGKLLNAVLLVVSMVKLLPHGVCSVNSLLVAVTVPTVPVREPNCGGVGAGGSSETVTPSVTLRFTDRSV